MKSLQGDWRCALGTINWILSVTSFEVAVTVQHVEGYVVGLSPDSNIMVSKNLYSVLKKSKARDGNGNGYSMHVTPRLCSCIGYHCVSRLQFKMLVESFSWLTTRVLEGHIFPIVFTSPVHWGRMHILWILSAQECRLARPRRALFSSVEQVEHSLSRGKDLLIFWSRLLF